MSENGHLKDSELRDTVIGGQLANKAARAADRLALAYATDFGRSLVATDTYRSRAAQEAVYAEKGPGVAAKPGTSVHGLGEAIDFASEVDNFGSVSNVWMRRNSERYGWIWPGWAQKESRFEPWHYEYADALNRGGLWLQWPEDGQVGLGSDSAYVASLQRHLNKVRGDHPQIAADGEYWMATYAAVRWYQKRHGLAPTGVVGTRTKVILKRDGIGKP